MFVPSAVFQEMHGPVHALKLALQTLLRDAGSGGDANGDAAGAGAAGSPAPAAAPLSPKSTATDLARRRYATEMRAAVERVEATMTDLNDFRVLDARAPMIDSRSSMALRSLLNAAAKYFRSMLPSGVQFGYRVSPGNAFATVDGKRLLQIIANGIRYGDVVVAPSLPRAPFGPNTHTPSTPHHASTRSHAQSSLTLELRIHAHHLLSLNPGRRAIERFAEERRSSPAPSVAFPTLSRNAVVNMLCNVTLRVGAVFRSRARRCAASEV